MMERYLRLLHILFFLPFALAELLSPHANVFNSLSSAMRQWGNTLNPNGASFVPGIIRAHTTLYHARLNKADPPTPEWLAFDSEMSFGIFDRFGRFPGWPRDTWMRTYAAKRDLRVGYFDGMSAMISNSGTFDFVDLMAFGLEGPPTGDRWGGVGNEYRRASGLCNWTKEYDLGFDGFVRMNAGFELIVCDWDAWNLIANVNVTRVHQSQTEPWYEWARSASWHNFVSDSRVELDWTKFVSAHGRGVLLDPQSSQKERRMVSMSNETLESIKDEVQKVALRPSGVGLGLNWQSIVDTITQRYSPRLLEIHSVLTRNMTNATDLEAAGTLVHIALVPYYDTTLEDLGLHKCINGFTWMVDPSVLTPEELKIYQSINYVLTEICRTFYQLFHSLPGADSLPSSTQHNISVGEPTQLIKTLYISLSWPNFITCPASSCSDEQGKFCSLAVWPVIWGGQPEDWPKCLGKEDFKFPEGWPGRGGGGGRRPPPYGGTGGPGRGPGRGPGGGGPPGGPHAEEEALRMQGLSTATAWDALDEEWPAEIDEAR